MDIKQELNEAIKMHQNNKFSEARAIYDKILQSNPKDHTTLSLNALTFYGEKNYNKAIDLLEEAIQIEPNKQYFVDLGSVYFEMKEYNQAIESITTAISKGDKSHNNFYNLALSYLNNDNPYNAIETFEELKISTPNDSQVHYNLGLAYEYIANYNKAVENFNLAIKLNRKNFDAIFALGCLCLKHKEFKNGWMYYETRFRKSNPTEFIRINKPAWDGKSSLKYKTILIHHEQGYGDSIMFARFIPKLVDLGARVLFKPQKGLEKLLHQSNPSCEIIDNSTALRDLNIDFDYYFPLLSLAKVFNIDSNNIPLTAGYLKSDPEKVKSYKKQFFDNNKTKIGICWQSNPNVSQQRPIELKYLAQLADNKNIQFYSLQKGYGTEQLESINADIIDIGRTFGTFDDTVSAIANLDLVITIDTSIAHLTGALGKKCFVLLPFSADWKWFINTDKSPWYDSITLIRQKKYGDWQSVINQLRDCIDKLI